MKQRFYMTAVNILFGLSCAALVPRNAFAQAQPAFNLANAKAFFDEAHDVSNKDGSKLWGLPLYGPLVFVDQNSRAVIANQPDKQNLLHKDGDLFSGKLEGIDPTNDDIEWAGVHWTMITWQLIPEDRLEREKLFAHEMFHRIQHDLNLRAKDALNQHLDAKEGRIWLRLEWRALAAALIEHGPTQEKTVTDALAFRKHRQQMFAGSSETERSLEIAEGVAEYTGLSAASPDARSARWFAAAQLMNPDLTKTFIRSFAYTSGPAYGLLLDERFPGWRKKLSLESDLSRLLASTAKSSVESVEKRATEYGSTAIRTAEEDRANKLDSVKTRYRKQLVEGPVLILPHTENTKITFNPSNLISLDQSGVVYPTLKVIADWGTMDVNDGALIAHGSKQITVAAPTKTAEGHAEGPGWTVNLSKGWQLTPSGQSGSLQARKLN